MNIDIASSEFQKFLIDYESYKSDDISESDTRSKVIDYVLINILGWNESDIQREGYIGNGFYDYKISIPGFYIVVEAKKQFIHFTLPNNNKIVTINTIYKENKEIIDQIRNYTSEASIDYGIATNGHQFIAGRFVNHDGKPWKNNQVLIFDGFDEIKNRFVDFYNNLAKSSIILHGGFKFLISGTTEKQYKILNNLIDRDKEIVRNTISSELAPIIEEIFGEIFSDDDEDNQEFIRECFVENKETIKNKVELNRLFEDNPPELGEVSKAKNLDSLITQIENEIKVPVIAKQVPPKPIIIVGSKGAGKTTFINYLFKNKLNGNTLKSHPHIYVNFIKYYKEDKTIDTEKISNDIINSLYEDYSELQLHTSKVLKQIYYKEIRINNESIWEDIKNNQPEEYSKKMNDFLTEKRNNHQEHLEYLSRYLVRERRSRIIIIIDNADQFDIEVQERVFLFANALYRNAYCGIFISLREGYYYKWRNKPPFDAYINNVYHISAPSYSEVLQKRIDYTVKKIDLADRTTGTNVMGYKLQIDNQHIIEFFSGLQNSLFDNKNKDIIDFLNFSTYPNIREGLRLFKLFLISGFTNVEEYILRVQYNPTETSVPVPLHEFVKSIGLYNKLYYNSEISAIPNIFYPCENSNDHFLKIWILKFLSSKLTDGGSIAKYDSYINIIESFVSYGYRTDILNKTILQLLDLELIESYEKLSDIKWMDLPNYNFNICISAKGYYYLMELKNRFHYLDLVLQDTPVYDIDSFNKLKKVFPSSSNDGKRNLNQRIESIKKFIEYLRCQENKQPHVLISKFGSIVEDIQINGLNKDLDRINNSNT